MHPIDSDLTALLDTQRRAFHAQPEPSLATRLDRLQRLEQLLRQHADALAHAIDADFGGRCADETQLLEIFPSIEGLRFARRHLARWMRAESRSVSMWFWPARAQVRWQPRGVVGVVAPWNYPLYLAVGPLTAALAAGNRVMLKPSELAPRFAALFAQRLAASFAADEVAVVQGDAQVAQAFCALPFDHLLFTGSTAVGRQVMHTAAQHLVPLTLELGGKSPALVAPGFDLALAARRIAQGKLLNAGQTCVAPDYALVPRGQEADFAAALKAAAGAMYGCGNTPDYTRIVNPRHHARLQGLLDEARVLGATCIPLFDEDSNTPRPATQLVPHALLQVPAEARILKEEIFGPLLPVLPYDSVEAAMAYINERDRPLALYVFDNDARRVDRILAGTRSGGVTVNDCVLHVAQDDLPFGGIGASGMGQYHGAEGFKTLSLARPVFRQRRFNTVPLLAPPYSPRTRRLLALMLGWGKSR